MAKPTAAFQDALMSARVAARAPRLAAGPVVLWQYTDPEGNTFWLDRKVTTTIRSPYGGTFTPKPKRVLPSQLGKLQVEKPKAEIAKVDDADDSNDLEAFAKKVIAIALSPQSQKFHDRVFIGSIKDLGFPRMDRAKFDSMMLAAHKAQLIRMARADLVAAMDPTMVQHSEINLMGGQWHFVTIEHLLPKRW